MFKIIRTAALSAVIGLGAIAALPATAEASGSSFSFGIGSGHGAVTFQFGNAGPRYHRGQPRYQSQRFCSDRDAVRKASQMGLRNVRVIHSSHRSVQVRGWSHRRGASAVTFARAPHCPIVARY